ncbi:hypothetical protein ACS96_18985 [Pseudomonas aeruginosa]|nr:hypothetical protein ACS96_18985 [Pseudomonas aeruginosa]
MARLDPALAEEIRRLPISRCLELIQALLDRAGPEVPRCSSDWGAERAIAHQQRRPYRGSER